MHDELAKLDATATAALIKQGEVSASEVLEATIARAEAADARLNFLVDRGFDQARARARLPLEGPFAGVPFLVKDLEDATGFVTRHGSRSTEGAAPAADQSAYVDALDAAGLVTFGKSSTPEYGFQPTTEPLAFGPTRNPWDPAHNSGGSSGGAAVAVAAGVVPVAHASDGGGSIRIPASACGLFGLKPSRGRLLPFGRRKPRAIDLSVSHVVSRSVRDSAALFAATEVAGFTGGPVGRVEHPSDRRLRVGLVRTGFSAQQPDTDVAGVVEAAAKLLADLGHPVEETAWPFEGPPFQQAFGVLWGQGAAMLVDEYRQAGGDPQKGFENLSLALAHVYSSQTPEAIERGLEGLRAASEAYHRWFDGLDVILSPVLSTPAPEIGWLAPDVETSELGRRVGAYVGYTLIHNVAGAPAMSVPLGMSAAGLPIGVQLAASVGAERTLFELAYELEAAAPWPGLAPA